MPISTERAMAAAAIATLTVGRPDNSAPVPTSVSVKKAAELFDVSERSVTDARVVAASGRQAHFRP